MAAADGWLIRRGQKRPRKNAAPASGLFLADIVPKISYFTPDTENKR